MLKRTAVMQYTGEIELSTKPLKIWGYGKKGATRNRVGEYVYRLEINSAGIAVYAGKKGLKRVANLSWEDFVARLTE